MTRHMTSPNGRGSPIFEPDQPRPQRTGAIEAFSREFSKAKSLHTIMLKITRYETNYIVLHNLTESSAT